MPVNRRNILKAARGTKTYQYQEKNNDLRLTVKNCASQKLGTSVKGYKKNVSTKNSVSNRNVLQTEGNINISLEKHVEGFDLSKTVQVKGSSQVKGK